MDVKNQVRTRFQPYRYLEMKVGMLEGRVLQNNEFVHDYCNDITRLYDILQNINKNYTDQEKVNKLADGLTGQLFNDVQLMSPTSPTDFLSKAAEAVDLSYRANQRIRPNFDATMPYDLINPRAVAINVDHRNVCHDILDYDKLTSYDEDFEESDNPDTWSKGSNNQLPGS